MRCHKKTILLFLLLVSLFLPSVSSMAEECKICLTMIVKNESKIIERCLNSAIDLVDCISICDTGSTDNTVEILEDYIQKAGIPGKVHRHEWRNFGHNRTLSCKAAQETLKELGFPLDSTYLLLLDADMIFESNPDFSKDSLTDDGYQLMQKSSSLSYYNTRLIRASLPWECLGVTHEYWSCRVPCRQAKFDALWIDDRDDGGCKADKFERDIRLLTQGLKDEPNNERYLFYLARSYHCLNQNEEAIKWYKARIDRGGWKEEVWYSKYMIGSCYEDMGDWDKAIAAYLDAFQYNPERAEPLQNISKYYRNNGKYDLAYLFAKQGSMIPYPKDQILFISHPVYEYLFDEDLSIAAYYTPFKDEGFAAVNRLMLKKNIPWNIRDQAYKNVLFYVEPLKNATYEPIKIDLPRIREEMATCFNPMNPSIQRTENGYHVICRTVNYMQIGATHFYPLDIMASSLDVKTRNFFVQYDRDFNLLSQKEIIEDLPRSRSKSHAEGLEDCRLFQFCDSLWFTCTTLDTNVFGIPQVSLCKLEDDRTKPSIHVEKLISFLGPDPRRCEKNWLPFVKGDELHVIYSYDPFVVYKPDLSARFSLMSPKTIAMNQVQTHDFTGFSGSASPIAFDDGYLLLVHEKIFKEQRYYFHRFVFLDEDFNIKQVSKSFIFFHKGVEYCCGMTLDHSEKQLVLAVGIEDKEAYLGFVDLDIVRSMLEPLSAN